MPNYASIILSGVAAGTASGDHNVNPRVNLGESDTNDLN